jgi:hypothetical protein
MQKTVDFDDKYVYFTFYIWIWVKLKLNSVVLVRKRTIPTERPQPAGEVNANFSW